MDFTFGLDAKELGKYGAKAVLFDAIRHAYRDIPIHPYVKVSPDADPGETQTQACRASNACFFVVRASSKYELLPGTAGMTESERFVHWSQIGEKIKTVRTPTAYYNLFVQTNGLEPEKVLPVVVQPMWAGSYGLVTEHPNQPFLTMVDFFKDDDSNNVFRERVYGGSYRLAELERLTARIASNNSSAKLKGGENSFYAIFQEGESSHESSGPLKLNTGNYQHLMDLARQLFEPIKLFGNGYACQGEFGPNGTAEEPVLYQFKPFMPKKYCDFQVNETQADMAFGICRDLELPVVRIKDADDLTADDFDSLSSTSPRTVEFLFDMGRFGQTPPEVYQTIIHHYQMDAARRARKQFNGDVCLAMPKYGRDDGIHFLEALKPAAVVIDDEFRSGMIHNRTNLIQSVPVAIFGHRLWASGANKVRISCDGKNALVEEL
jgi:hypothetical protein